MTRSLQTEFNNLMRLNFKFLSIKASWAWRRLEPRTLHNPNKAEAPHLYKKLESSRVIAFEVLEV